MKDRNVLPRQREEGLRIHELSGEVLIHDEVNKKVHVLNNTAAFIWNMCDGNTDVIEALNLLYQNYPDESRDRIKNDFEMSLTQLFQAELFERVIGESNLRQL